MSKMKVWLVTAEAVYDHGCFGVFSTVEAAEAHALELWNASDGHHSFRIEAYVVNEPRQDDDGILEGWSSNPAHRDRKRSRIEERNGGPGVRVVDADGEAR